MRFLNIQKNEKFKFEKLKIKQPIKNVCLKDDFPLFKKLFLHTMWSQSCLPSLLKAILLTTQATSTIPKTCPKLSLFDDAVLPSRLNYSFY